MGDISNIAPVTRCALVNKSSSSTNACTVGKERLSRSISLSLSLKSPLETVPSMPSSPNDVDHVDGADVSLSAARPMADLSPTTALARLTFDAMETDQPTEVHS